MTHPQLTVRCLIAGILLALVASSAHVSAAPIVSERIATQSYPVFILHDDAVEVPWPDWLPADAEAIQADWTAKVQAALEPQEGGAPGVFGEGTLLPDSGVSVEKGIVIIRLHMAASLLSERLVDQREAVADWLLSEAEVDPRIRSVRAIAKSHEQIAREQMAPGDIPADDPYAKAGLPDWTNLAYCFRIRPPVAYKPGDLPMHKTVNGLPAEEPLPLPAGDEFRAQPRGALTGATVFVNPGHGWLYHGSDPQWRTQRGPSQGLIEDHSNAEALLQWLVPYLWNAGARVVTCRERDLNPYEVTVTLGDPGCSIEGDWRQADVPGARDGKAMVATTSTEASARVVYAPSIAKSGHYAVYVWYAAAPQEGAPAVRDARFEVSHAGGRTVWVQDQRRDGHTWKYIGTYWFDAGADARSSSVAITNESMEAGRTVMAGAVRFGGGMGDYLEENGSTSGMPRWEESGMYYAHIMGFDPKPDPRVYGSVSAMSRYAEWEMEAWERGRSIYVAWHTNASAKGESRGMSSFVYGPNAWGQLSEFSGYPGGVELLNAVHDRVLNAVRATVAPDWADAGKISRWLGETNPYNNKKMPAALFEYGFHDNKEDGDLILSPGFRNICGRATYQGIVQYFHQNVPGFDIGEHLPEPPTHLRAELAGGQVMLSWNAPAADDGKGVLGGPATGYRVYRSMHGRAFDSGMAVEGTSLGLPLDAAGRANYYRVTATNAGGESLPSETLAVFAPAFAPDAFPRVLLVNGFDRMDRGLHQVLRDERTGATWERGIVSRMNTRDYVVEYASLMQRGNVAFTTASKEAVAEGLIDLLAFRTVIWMAGREGGRDGNPGLQPAEIEKLRAHASIGGRLLLTGSDVLWDLDFARRDRPFARQVLRAQCIHNDAESHVLIPAAGGLWAGLPVSIPFGGDAAVYNVPSPDMLWPEGEGSRAVLEYQGPGPGGRRIAAVANEAVATEGGAYGRNVVLGFPLETVERAEDRQAILISALEFLLADYDAPAPLPPAAPEPTPTASEENPPTVSTPVASPAP